MRLCIATLGTRGDVAPFASLAAEMVSRGHAVDFCAPPDHEALAAESGASFVPVGEAYAEVFREVDAGPRRLFSVMSRQVPAQFAALEPVVRRADFVLSGSMEYATPTLCEQYRKPRRAVLMSPVFVPGERFPMPLIRWYNLPRWLNRLSWWFADRMSALSIGRLIDGERVNRGLKPCGRPSAHVIGSEAWVPFPASLYAMQAADHYPFQQMDPWLATPRPLPAPLLEFLATQRPPLFVTTGSMPVPDGLPEAVCDAAERLRVPLLTQGFSVPGCRVPSFSIREPVSHAALFRHCVAIVHHGGAGTMIAALHARRPQIVVPHVADQHFSARVLSETRQGLGFDKDDLRGPLSGASLEFALVLHLAPKPLQAPPPEIRNGVGSACDRIEALVGNVRG